jgi:hypothetical protein
MADPVPRHKIIQSIYDLIGPSGATHVTMTFSAADAKRLAEDLSWAVKTTIRDYHAEKIEGEDRSCVKSRNK